MVSIVIVNWNSGKLLENCVRSLLRNAAGCQIIVVDNASTDSSLLFLEQMQGGPAIIRNSQNIGFAAGSNLGWRAGKGSHILFLNPDTECFPGSVDRPGADADRRQGGLGGRRATRQSIGLASDEVQRASLSEHRKSGCGDVVDRGNLEFNPLVSPKLRD